MHSRPYILHGISPTDFSVRKAEIAELVREFGLVVLPSFLSENIFFRNFEDDLKVILLETCDRYSVEITSN